MASGPGLMDKYRETWHCYTPLHQTVSWSCGKS